MRSGNDCSATFLAESVKAARGHQNVRTNRARCLRDLDYVTLTTPPTNLPFAHLGHGSSGSSSRRVLPHSGQVGPMRLSAPAGK